MQPERLKNWRQLCLNSLEGINQVNWAIPPKYLKTEILSRAAGQLCHVICQKVAISSRIIVLSHGSSCSFENIRR